MNKSNIAKVFIAVLLIAVVAVATYNYGETQRKKAASLNDPTKSSLPTVKDEAKNNAESNPQSGSDSQDKQGIDTPSTPPVSAQIPSQNIPATGPADNFIPVLALGSLTGLSLVSRRRIKNRA
mgnify:FL=1